MNKFKEGDIVTGKPCSNDRYDITTDKAIMKVVNVWNSGVGMRVKILEHKNKSNHIGRIFKVNSKYFKKAVNSVRKIKL